MKKWMKGIIVGAGVILTAVGVKSLINGKAENNEAECDYYVDDTEDADVVESDAE